MRSRLRGWRSRFWSVLYFCTLAYLIADILVRRLWLYRILTQVSAGFVYAVL